MSTSEKNKEKDDENLDDDIDDDDSDDEILDSALPDYITDPNKSLTHASAGQPQMKHISPNTSQQGPAANQSATGNQMLQTTAPPCETCHCHFHDKHKHQSIAKAYQNFRIYQCSQCPVTVCVQCFESGKHNQHSSYLKIMK